LQKWSALGALQVLDHQAPVFYLPRRKRAKKGRRWRFGRQLLARLSAVTLEAQNPATGTLGIRGLMRSTGHLDLRCQHRNET